MFEKGHGKVLNCILAFTADSVMDVTRRYTRDYVTTEFQARRRAICPGGEVISDHVIVQFNDTLRLKKCCLRKGIQDGQTAVFQCHVT